MKKLLVALVAFIFTATILSSCASQVQCPAYGAPKKSKNSMW